MLRIQQQPRSIVANAIRPVVRLALCNELDRMLDPRSHSRIATCDERRGLECIRCDKVLDRVHRPEGDNRHLDPLGGHGIRPKLVSKGFKAAVQLITGCKF